MRFERFDPVADTGRLEACREICAASQAQDDPAGRPMTPARFRVWWTSGHDGEPREFWLAEGPGGPAGCLALELPGPPNQSLADLYLYVTPAQRRSGTGSTLLARAAARAQAAGRTLLLGSTVAGSAGEAFARAAGATPGLRQARRVMPVGDGTAALLARLRAEAAAAASGYSVTCWSGPVPDADLDQVAALHAAIGDAPREADVQPSRWDAARIRQREQWFAAAGLRLLRATARHGASGGLAAVAAVAVTPGQPGRAEHGITAVAREHRGHRLGLLVKTALYQELAARQPGLREISTWNAEGNAHMVAINDRLGFRAVTWTQGWQLPVGPAAGSRGAQS